MAQNEPQRKETPPGRSPNSPSLLGLFEYQCRSGKFIRLGNRIEKNRFGSENQIESKLFCPNWMLYSTAGWHLSAHVAALCRSGYCTSSDNFARSSSRWQCKVQEPQLWRLFPAGWITAIRCSTRHGTGSFGSSFCTSESSFWPGVGTEFFPVFD